MGYVHAYMNTPISFNPYQYKPLMALREDANKNLLISDEVGLGKTIEAGIIIDDLIERKPDARVLIVCPAFLRSKWASELEDKFYMYAGIFGKGYFAEGDQITILPVSKLKEFSEHVEHKYDLIVVDEIHYFKNNTSMRFKYLNQIIMNSPKAKRVFMSATPINNTSEDYASIQILLGGVHSTTNTTKKQSYIELKKRNITEEWIELSAEEQEMYDATDVLPAFSGTIYRHIGASCLYSLAKYASQGNYSETKQELLDAMDLICFENDVDSIDYNDFEQMHLVLPEVDSKLERLKEILEKNGDKHIVIFTHYIETVKYLYQQIRSLYSHIGRGKDNVGYLYANNSSFNIPIKNKKNRFVDVKKWFDEKDTNRLLICSDSCKEGVDLQVASVLINYDLPFNPSIMEQRIGRIDRTGQLNDMHIYNFHVSRTYDDRLHMILSTKLRLINYYAQYGIGNPLHISNEGESKILKGFIRYFAKSDLSNDDIEVTLRMLRKIVKDVPTIQQVKQNNQLLRQLVESHQNDICEWFSKDVEIRENEDLVKLKDEYIKYLNFDKNPGLVYVELGEKSRKEIAAKCNEDPNFRIKSMALLRHPESIMFSLEETGEIHIITENDIINEYIQDYENPDFETFVPYEIIKEWR